MIPTYNCSHYLRRTLDSVLMQDPGPDQMQIEVVDDNSQDDVEALVCEMGKGRVTFFRQPHNVGSLRNFHTCINRAKGHLVHILHGDDKVRHGFYSRLSGLFEQYPVIGAAYSRFAYIDEHDNYLFDHEAEMHEAGILQNWLVRLCERQRIQFAAIAIRRDVYEKLGGFYGVEYGEDWEMWVRIASQYTFAYTPEVLAEYRRHSASISGRSMMTGKNMEDLEQVMMVIHQRLPEEARKEIEKKSRAFYAEYALRVANALWSEFRSDRGARAQMRAAWKMNNDFLLLYKIIKLQLRILLNV